MFFESGRPVPTESGGELLTRLAEELGKLPNNVLIEGHTDSKPFSGDGSYSNWELSADRANSARKIMEAHGLREGQVGQVRGYAARQLRHPEDPENASNRRISVIVQYLPPGPGEHPKAEPPAAEHPGVEPPKAQPPAAGHPGAEPPKAQFPAAEHPGAEPPKTQPPAAEHTPAPQPASKHG